ncbi:hypothetical protein CH367_19565 [Leptospira barantonii]|uniref:DUF1564 family protein n=1 Tax=Leptospira barantonii TaxID=2023184 RepID=A0ABX4NG51_9LEPT|nr:hypothetical protein CH367_19565 [Leptospira barantonii]
MNAFLKQIQHKRSRLKTIGKIELEISFLQKLQTIQGADSVLKRPRSGVFHDRFLLNGDKKRYLNLIFSSLWAKILL